MSGIVHTSRLFFVLLNLHLCFLLDDRVIEAGSTKLLALALVEHHSANPDWPGLGRLTVSAISNRDCALVQGCLLSIGLTDGLVNLPRSCFITF